MNSATSLHAPLSQQQHTHASYAGPRGLAAYHLDNSTTPSRTQEFMQNLFQYTQSLYDLRVVEEEMIRKRSRVIELEGRLLREEQMHASRRKASAEEDMDTVREQHVASHGKKIISNRTPTDATPALGRETLGDLLRALAARGDGTGSEGADNSEGEEASG